jgi:hypothetical protein
MHRHWSVSSPSMLWLVRTLHWGNHWSVSYPGTLRLVRYSHWCSHWSVPSLGTMRLVRNSLWCSYWYKTHLHERLDGSQSIFISRFLLHLPWDWSEPSSGPGAVTGQFLLQVHFVWSEPWSARPCLRFKLSLWNAALNKESILCSDCSWVRFVQKTKRAPVPLQLVRKNLPLAQSLVSYFSRTLSLARTFLWCTTTACTSIHWPVSSANTLRLFRIFLRCIVTVQNLP